MKVYIVVYNYVCPDDNEIMTSCYEKKEDALKEYNRIKNMVMEDWKTRPFDKVRFDESEDDGDAMFEAYEEGYYCVDHDTVALKETEVK